jgi:transcriptional regulator with XRE-family HTH domain
VTAAQTIGLNVARLRKAHGWSQTETGRRLSLLLEGKPWSRQAMHTAERGQRAWTANEIAAAAELFRVTPGTLFESVTCAVCRGFPPPGFVCIECGAKDVAAPAGGAS